MFKPAKGCVLVEPFKEDSIIASADRSYQQIATVLQTDGKWWGIRSLFGRVPKVGDVIFFDEYAYRRFNYQGKDYCVVDISNGGLWGVIHNEPSTQGELVQEEGLLAPIPPIPTTP